MGVVALTEELNKIHELVGSVAEEEILESINLLRNRLLKQDVKNLRDASFVLEREGKSYQQDLFERINLFIDGLDKKFNSDEMELYSPKKNIMIDNAARLYEKEREDCYDIVMKIRNKLSCEEIKRALYIMTWELADSDMEDLIALFREAIIRYEQMNKNIFKSPKGVEEIQSKLALLGIVEVVPREGDEFDPVWHLHSAVGKTGFDFRVKATVHSGYKRNGRRILKAIVDC